MQETELAYSKKVNNFMMFWFFVENQLYQVIYFWF